MGRYPSVALFTMGCFVACSSSAPNEGADAPGRAGTRLVPIPGGSEVEVVYESIKLVDAQGEESAREQGTVTADTWQRVARPWTYGDEEQTYHEQAWERSLADGGVERGYRILRGRNGARTRSAPSTAPTRLDARLIEAAKGTSDVPVTIVLRDLPRSNIPLALPPSLLGDAEANAVAADRQAALGARRDLFEHVAKPALDHLASIGATVLGRGWRGGWISAKVPPGALATLLVRPDVAAVYLALGGPVEQGGGADEAYAEEATDEASPVWNIGAGRELTRMDVDRFHAAGHTGKTPNPTRHAYGSMIVGVNELADFEDEGCYLYDTPGCSGVSRVIEKLACDGPTPGARCQTTTNLPEVEDEAFPNTTCDALTTNKCARHGTLMTSVILGNYEKGQGTGFQLGDDAWTSGAHSDLFTRRATGMAPEARLVFWGQQRLPTNDPSAVAEPYLGAIARHVDVLNTSWVWDDADANGNKKTVTGGDCNPVPIYPFELDAEEAYDDGVFLPSAAGNNSNAGATVFDGVCDVLSPADIPKVFAVNGFTATSGVNQAIKCQTNYNNCSLAPAATGLGGATVTTPDLVAHPGALSIISLVGPAAVEFTTYEGGPFASVDDDPANNQYRPGGTSTATAHITGVSTVIKDANVANGNLWINAPGRLHTVMLAMGDRASGSAVPPVQRTVGADPGYGMGRIKARLFEPGSNVAPYTTTEITWSLTAATPTLSTTTTSDALPEGTRLVKCVALQEEDMSGKSTMSQTSLKVEIGTPTIGTSCLSTTPDWTNTDDSFDVKKMVAVKSSTTPLAGKCVTVTATAQQLAEPILTVHLFCYSAGIPDDCGDPQCCDVPVNTPCNADDNACTVGDACDAAGECKPGAVASAGTTCRASAGACDVAETCDGTGAACPADGFVAAGTECRASADACDVAETCDGSAASCPPNAPFTPATVEVCDGVDNDCDGLVDEGFDADGDGFKTCGASPDCNDANPAVHPQPGGCCADLATDVQHCGTCATACSIDGAISSCSTGTCKFVGCQAGHGNCNATLADGCEVDTANDADNCGACGVKCGGKKPFCTQGVCGNACPPGHFDCDGKKKNGCESTLTSLDDCGACGVKCKKPHAQTTCATGSCTVFACKPGWTDANGNPADGCEKHEGGNDQCGDDDDHDHDHDHDGHDDHHGH